MPLHMKFIIGEIDEFLTHALHTITVFFRTKQHKIVYLRSSE